MTEQHPLTDELIQDIEDKIHDYVLLGEDVEANSMRAAADWQLEQVVAWLEDNLGSSMYLQLAEDNGTEVNVSYVIQHLREEMRPL